MAGATSGTDRATTASQLSSRERIVQATAELMRAKGFAATGLNEITTVAHAPKGSMYHYFPEGKEQLGAEAIEWYGDLVLGLIADSLDGVPPPSGLRRFLAALEAQLEQSQFAAGCPVAVTALEAAPASPALTKATRAVFERWISTIERSLRAAGVPSARATAVTVVAAIEGAITLARAEQSTEPLRAVGRIITTLVTPPERPRHR